MADPSYLKLQSSLNPKGGDWMEWSLIELFQEAETNRTWWISTQPTVRVPAHIIAIKDGQGTGKPKVSKIQQGNLEAKVCEASLMWVGTSKTISLQNCFNNGHVYVANQTCKEPFGSYKINSPKINESRWNKRSQISESFAFRVHQAMRFLRWFCRANKFGNTKYE